METEDVSSELLEDNYDSVDEILSGSDENSSNSDDDYIKSYVDDSFMKEKKLCSDFTKWALRYQIPHSALQEIAAIFNNFDGKNVLQKDPRAVLHSPQNVKISSLGENQNYWHNGMKLCLQNVFKRISKSMTISLNFNLDGLPIFKSSKDEFWPILFNIVEMPEINPLMVGVFHGQLKS